MNEDKIEYTSEERIFSAISHAAIVLPYLGLLAPLAIWITMREKSPWLRYQALQALAYQILQFVFLMIGSCLVIPLFMITPLFGINDPEKMFIPMMLTLFLPYLIWALLILLGLFGGMMCAFGKDFHYPILGKRIKNYIDENGQA